MISKARIRLDLKRVWRNHFMNNDYKIIYNEKEGRYDLEYNGQVVSTGTWEVVVYTFASMLLEDPSYSACTMEGAMECAKEMISEQISDEDLNGYMLEDLSDDLRDQEKLTQLVLDFACDVLDVMRTSKREIFGANPEVRKQIKIVAYSSVLEIIDKYADKLQRGDRDGGYTV